MNATIILQITLDVDCDLQLLRAVRRRVRAGPQGQQGLQLRAGRDHDDLRFYAAYSSRCAVRTGPAWSASPPLIGATSLRLHASSAIGFSVLRHRGVSPMFVFIFTIMASQFVAYVAMLVFGTWPTTIFAYDVLAGDAGRRVAVSAWDLPAIGATVAVLVGAVGLPALYPRRPVHDRGRRQRRSRRALRHPQAIAC